MPPTPKPDWKVELDIATEATLLAAEHVVGGSGYKRSSVSGYWYKYTGGNTANDNGDITIDNNNRDANGFTIEVSLKGSSNGKYDIKSGDLKSSSSDITLSHPSGNKITITDTEQTNNETIDYGVTVNPKNETSPDIGCDPTIKHIW